MDKLERIFELQKQFQIILGNQFLIEYKEIKYFDNIHQIKNQLLALFSETGEALNEIPWKPWKRNQEFNIAKFRMELIDCFHFLINLFLYSGMDADDVFVLFQKKNEINRRRQRDGY